MRLSDQHTKIGAWKSRLARLIKNKGKVNFNSVSEESGVSKAYLYTHSDIRDRIDALRKQQEGLPSPKQLKREMTDASKDVIIAAKNKLDSLSLTGTKMVPSAHAKGGRHAGLFSFCALKPGTTSIGSG